MQFRLAKIMLFGACPVAIVLGSWVLSDYSFRPGDPGHVATDLYSVEKVPGFLDGSSATKSDTATLILFFHPHCPCTKATIRNLERVFTRFSRQTRIVAFGFCPSAEPDSWISSPITSALQRLDANIIADKDGKYCSRFGVNTSGHVLVYCSRGSLLFSGGITPGRGHEGDCLATSDLLLKVGGHNNDTVHWPVYGCPIVVSEVPQS